MMDFSRFKRSVKDESGVIMLEAMIVYGVTLMLLFMILAVFSVLYQRWNLQTIANESAARVAQTYRYATVDESSGYVELKNHLDIGPYRYMTNAITKKMETTADSRISKYALDRLSRTTFTNDVVDPKCVATIKPDAMGRRHVEVVIVGEYAVPFGEVLDYFGLGGTITYEVTAYADCVDIVDYIGFVDFMNTQLSLKVLDSKVIALVDSVWALLDEIFFE